MNKYNNNNNFSRTGDNSMRFNKHSRYGANNGGCNSNPRYKHQSQSGYQYSNNRSNTTTDSYPYNHYEKNTRNVYGISSKRPNNHQHKQSSPYLHKFATSLSISPFSNSFSIDTQNVFNLPPTQHKLTSQLSSTTAIEQNNQEHSQQCTPVTLDNSNCYGFGYNNFYPTSYNADVISTASKKTFGASDSMSSYMWETIKSTPPPKLPQQQPPLPEHEPPPILPPLPSDDMPLLPPPLIPALILASSWPSAKDQGKKKSNDKETDGKTVVKMKAKRKAMSVRYKRNKCWVEEDSRLALKAEETNAKKPQTDILIVRFPDPEISRETVKCYSPDIESVHFQLNFAPRYCLVHLKPGTDVNKTIENLSKIPFGTGFLSVEIKKKPSKVPTTELNKIDPYSLYVGNLPITIACNTLREHFPGATRIDVGFTQRMRYTRYAFVKYNNVQEAIDAYKRMLDAEIGGRTLSIRFKRLLSSIDGNKDGENPDDMHDDLSSQTTATSEDNSITLTETYSESAEPIDSLREKSQDIIGYNLNFEPQNSVKSKSNLDNNTAVSNTQAETVETVDSQISSNEPLLTTGKNSAQTSITAENSLVDINNATRTTPFTENTSTTQDNFIIPIQNIKPDPDPDDDDIVIRNNAISTRFEETIKQEKELDLYSELFARPNNKNDSRKAQAGNDIVSLTSTTDETDTMSTLSFNSLGEILQTCQRPQTQSKYTAEIGPTPRKRNRVSEDVLCDTIKKEPLKNINIVTEVRQETVKQEPVQGNAISIVSDKNMSLSEAANKTVPRKRRETIQAGTSAIAGNSTNPQSNTTNNDDDLVPPTAFSFTSRYQNTMTSSVNECAYDEFFETGSNASHHTSTNLANIKKEPLAMSRGGSTNENRKNVLQEVADINESVTIKHNDHLPVSAITTTISNAIDEDDLVPAQNELGFCRPLRSEIKLEMEHDDMFSVPISIRNNLNVDSNLGNILNITESVTNICSQSDRSKITNDTLTCNESLNDNDDDVIIISDNISRRTQHTDSNTSILSNLFLRRHTDLSTVKPNPIVVTIPNRKVSKLLDRDNLDKLYEQLDADSDSDL